MFEQTVFVIAALATIATFFFEVWRYFKDRE